MRAVVVDVICRILPFFVKTAYAAADGGLAGIVLSERAGIGQYGFEELYRHYLLPVIHHRVDSRHAYVLDNAEVCEIFLTEGHPETGATDRGEVEDKTLKFFVIEQV